MPILPIWFEEGVSLAWRHWKAILGATVVISVLVYIGILKGEVSHYHKLSDQFAEQNKLLEATYRAAQNTARANNLEAVRRAEADGNAISERKQGDLQKQLADARGLAADYARRMRAGAPGNDQGRAGQTRVSETADTPSDPIAASRNALVPEDDLRICADNTVKARGWQDFYTTVRDRYNALTIP